MVSQLNEIDPWLPRGIFGDISIIPLVMLIALILPETLNERTIGGIPSHLAGQESGNFNHPKTFLQELPSKLPGLKKAAVSIPWGDKEIKLLLATLFTTALRNVRNTSYFNLHAGATDGPVLRSSTRQIFLFLPLCHTTLHFPLPSSETSCYHSEDR